MARVPDRRLDRLLAQVRPEFRAQFLAVVRSVLDEHSLAELADLVERGRVDEALGRIATAAAGKLGAQWSRSFVRAGTSGSDYVTRAVRDIIVHFDQTNVRAVSAMRSNQLRLVREFTAEQRAATRQALMDGVRRGLNPVEQARAIRGSIGLTQRQQQAVDNYRRSLESGGTSSMQRELRDRRFDRSVVGAAERGEALPAAKVEQMVERYRQNMLSMRAEAIARTEALSSVHEGNQEAFQQAVDGGQLDPEQVERTWNTAEDSRVRDSHDTMDGQTRGLDEPFTSGNGVELMYPGDPGAPPEERIQCRCAVSVRILGPTPEGASVEVQQDSGEGT